MIYREYKTNNRFHKEFTEDADNGDIINISYYRDFDGTDYTNKRFSEDLVYTRNATTGVLEKIDHTETIWNDTIQITSRSFEEHFPAEKLGLILGKAAKVTISAGSITPMGSNIRIETEGSASTDDLETIVNVSQGAVLVIRAFSASNTVVLKDDIGNLKLNGDFNLTHIQDSITLINTGASWIELSRSNNKV